MNPLRMGVIGLGAIAQVMHLPYMTDYDEKFTVVAISDVSEPALKAVGDHYGIQNRYTDWREMLQREDIDAVGIFHSGSHKDTIIAALDADKHVFVEKPVAWSVSEAQDIADRAHRSDRIVQVAYHKLYDPGFAYAREQVAQMRDLGIVRITVLHPDNQLGLSPHRIRRGGGVIDEGHVESPSWDTHVQGSLRGLTYGPLEAAVDAALGARKDDPRLRIAYGMMTVSLIHQVYMMFGFLGDPLRAVSTDVWRDGLSIHSLIEYPNDVRVELDWHMLSHLKDYREEYAFWGNYDRVYMQLPSPYFKSFPSPVIVQGGDGELAWEKRVIVSYEEAFRLELMAFYDNVRSGTMPFSNVDTAVKHMAFIQQMIDAAR